MEFNLAEVQERVAEEFPGREAILWRTQRRTAGELTDRSRRIANLLLAHGLGVHTERRDLQPHESGQDHLAVYLRDCPEYLEAMFGAFKARLAPFNVNFRYTANELRGLFRSGRPRAIVYQGEFTPEITEVLPEFPEVELLLRVDDGSGHPPPPGAVDFEEAIKAAPAHRPPVVWSPDDLYLLFTGGTTGVPKAVLWRQADIFVRALGGWRYDKGARERHDWGSLDAIAASARRRPAERLLTGAPLMHGAGQWPALQALLHGGTVVLPGVTDRSDPDDLLDTVERERVATLFIVGDAFARPLLEALRRKARDLSGLRFLLTGGAALTAGARAELLEWAPHLTIIETMGSSESGPQAWGRSSGGDTADVGRFRPYAGTCVADEEIRGVLPAGHDAVGWLATSGRIPLGYLGDPDKTAKTFPVIDGIRRVIPGDRARHLRDGVIEVLGRDAVTINSGGEKIFAEEVEATILADHRVRDVTVVGRPSERWGAEVVALVQRRDGETVTADELVAAVGGLLPRYKRPKQVVFVDQVKRSPTGKPDYRWAREVAVAASL